MVRKLRPGVAVGVAAVLLVGTAGTAGISRLGASPAATDVPTLAEARRDAAAAAPAAPAARGAAGPSYATDRPVQATPSAGPPPLPLTTDDYGDPNAVIIRVPDRDYGSGYHGDYGVYHRETSPPDQLAAAAAASNGCLVVGDSIATFVVRDLVADLRRTSGDECVYDTWPGRATEGTANALLEIKRKHGLPPRVIVMSGTNDIFNPPLFERQMNRLIDGIGPGREIIWVNTFDSRRPTTEQSAADERNTAWINSVLQAKAARTPALHLVRWDSLFRGDAHNVEVLLSDGVHPNAAGIDAMVDLVRASLAAPGGDS
ncbi:MAG: hypothetical protein IPK37_08600 [Austwickia sp.]|jgi:hypothetical protein|nr:MAG: hypothetical protein IPK37_08600 [Austwickia sp.]